MVERSRAHKAYYKLMRLDLSELDKHDAEVYERGYRDGGYQATASMKQHDAEVRKPLVDALEAMMKVHISQCEQCSGPDDGCDEGQRLEQTKLDALSQVKP